MNITLNQTCGACPEQYDAVDENGRIVGYLRLRHGCFTAEAIGEDDQRHDVYTAYPIGDGVFDPDERERHLSAATRAIRAHFEPSPYDAIRAFPLDMAEIRCPHCQATAYPDSMGEAMDWAIGGHGCKPEEQQR